MKILHEYQTPDNSGVRAEVVFDGKTFGCNFYNQGVLIKTEMYEGKSEAWAESAAENYVDGIKLL
tara:strand:- start:153 stop:347 length:195 start_codon:yes stop_codon:yes gene_type:complete